jgi:hypothetical protein
VPQFVLIKRPVRGVARLGRHRQDLVLRLGEENRVGLGRAVAQLERIGDARHALPRQHRQQEETPKSASPRPPPPAGRPAVAARGKRIAVPSPASSSAMPTTIRTLPIHAVR